MLGQHFVKQKKTTTRDFPCKTKTSLQFRSWRSECGLIARNWCYPHCARPHFSINRNNLNVFAVLVARPKHETFFCKKWKWLHLNMHYKFNLNKLLLPWDTSVIFCYLICYLKTKQYFKISRGGETWSKYRQCLVKCPGWNPTPISSNLCKPLNPSAYRQCWMNEWMNEWKFISL